jgi:hypothetical protein
LLISFSLAHATPWAKAGHEVAWEQFELPISAPGEAFPPPLAELPALRLVETTEVAAITGSDFRLILDKGKGRLTSFQYKGRELLLDGPRLNIWRAPTDNDANTWGDQRMAIRWRKAGLDRLREAVQTVTVSQPEPQVVQITTRSVWAPDSSPVRPLAGKEEGDKPAPDWAAASIAYPPARLDCQLDYTIYGSGDLLIEAHVAPNDDSPPLAPRWPDHDRTGPVQHLHLVWPRAARKLR